MHVENPIYVRHALGRHGKPIHIYKIRTMCQNAESRLEEVAQAGLDGNGKIPDDPRITPIGAYLRRYFVDEIPQIINLLKGDISLVGIRPRGQQDWQYFPEEHKQRALQYKPGLCGVGYAKKNGESNNLEHLVTTESEYLDLKENSHFADLKYFVKIWYNVLLKGVRSA